jgi:chromosome partitioning protein
VEELCESLDHQLNHVGIIISRVGRTAYHRDNIVTSLRTQFGDLVLKTELKERVAVSESAASQKPVFDSADGQAPSVERIRGYVKGIIEPTEGD